MIFSNIFYQPYTKYYLNCIRCYTNLYLCNKVSLRVVHHRVRKRKNCLEMFWNWSFWLLSVKIFYECENFLKANYYYQANTLWESFFSFFVTKKDINFHILILGQNALLKRSNNRISPFLSNYTLQQKARFHVKWLSKVSNCSTSTCLQVGNNLKINGGL